MPTDIDQVDFATELEILGYSKYAESVDIDTIFQTMIVDFAPAEELPMVLNNKTERPLDFRYYFCDNEDLFEEGE